MIVLKNILVATDLGEASHTALLYGRNVARAFSATMHVLYVVDDLAAHGTPLSSASVDYGSLQADLETAAREGLNALVTDDDRQNLRAQVVVLPSAAPAAAILEYARDAHIDLIIVGTHGRTGFAHLFMGSVAEHIVRAAPCPVLTVRHPEREFVRPDALQTVPPSAPRVN